MTQGKTNEMGVARNGGRNKH